MKKYEILLTQKFRTFITQNDDGTYAITFDNRHRKTLWSVLIAPDQYESIRQQLPAIKFIEGKEKQEVDEQENLINLLHKCSFYDLYAQETEEFNDAQDIISFLYSVLLEEHEKSGIINKNYLKEIRSLFPSELVCAVLVKLTSHI